MIVRLLLVFGLCTASAAAQDLKSVLPDSLTGKDFDYLFDRIEDQRTSEEARTIYLQSFLIKAKSEKNYKELAEAYKNYVHYAADKTKLVYADSMVAAAKNSRDDATIGAAYLSKGIAYYGQKRLTEALDFYLVADRYISKTSDRYLAYKIKYNIGQIKYYLGYYDEAIALFKECIEFFKPVDNRGYLNSLHSLGLCYNMVGDHGLCTSVNELGIKEGLRLGNRDMEAYFIHSEGVNQCLVHNYASAIEKIARAMPAIVKNKDFANETVGNFYLGKSYWGLGNKDKALPYFRKVDECFMERGYMRPDLRESYELLISYYKEKGLPASQLHYIEKLLEVDKSLHRTYRYLQDRIRKVYDTKTLLAEKQQIERSLRSRKYNDAIFLSIIVIMFIAMAVLIARHVTSKRVARKKYEELLLKIESAQKAKKAATQNGNVAIGKDALATVLHNLEKFESGRKFKDSELTLTKLAGQFNTNTKYLSHVISTHKGKKFNDYINDLKVDEIAERIRDDKLIRNYTHKALAEEAGFSSTRRFVNAFSARTGISVVYFIEELKRDQRDSTQ